MPPVARLFVACLSVAVPVFAQKPMLLHATAGHDTHIEAAHEGAAPLRVEQYVSLRAHFTQAANGTEASVYLVAEMVGPSSETLTLRIPLASTGEAYGESRTCKGATAATPQQAIFTAGLDEANFIPFAVTAEDHSFHLLLNKYLCRALVAPFHCGSREFLPSHDVSAWRVRQVHVELHSEAPAALRVSPPQVHGTAKAFDYAQCALIAPSNGICCVEHKTTEWHCGGAPTGDGWHQVSGDCFHRETGGSCTE